MITRFANCCVAVIAATAMFCGTAHAESVLFPNPFAPPPAPPRPELGAPRIHIDSDFPITLHRTTVPIFGGDPREIACQAPCDTIVDGRQSESFYFAGDEIPRSKPFRLIEKSGEVVAHVRPGNRVALKIGEALIVPTVLTLIAGAVLLPFDFLTRDPGTASTVQNATFAMFGVGVASLVTSIALIVVGRTRFDFENRIAPDGVQF